MDKGQCVKTIAAYINSYKMNGFGMWALFEKESNTLIGHCGFNILHGISETEIAYLLEKKYWLKGYATEIAKATLDYGFKILDLRRLLPWLIRRMNHHKILLRNLV